MIIYTMHVIFLKYQILMFFLFWIRKSRSHGKRKNGNIKRKTCAEKRINTPLKNLSIALNNHGWLGLLSFLSSLPISVLCYLELEANKFSDRANKLYKANSTNLYPPMKGYLRETCKSQNINPIYLTLSSPTVSFRS